MPDVRIKTPNLDDIFEKWKNSAVRKNKKKMEKEYGTKGAVFSLDAVSAAETVKDTMKEAAVYFSIKKTVGVSKEKDENLVLAPRLSKETFYSFKGEGKIEKENWKGDESVPMLESIKGIPCKECRGKGYLENKCKTCKGTGKIVETWTVLIGEDQNKQKKNFEYPCGDCFGDGFSRQACKECGGHKNKYKYEILPVPFKTVVTGIPVLHSSGETKYEKQIGDELIKVIDTVEGIRFTDIKDLGNKAEASLGYYNNKIKKTISSASNDYKKYEKDKSSQIQSQIHLFPMIQMMCQTKKGSKFEIYSIGSGNKFMVFSDF